MAKHNVEFRIPEDEWQQFVGRDIGKLIGRSVTGLVRKVEVPIGDQLYEEIGRIHRTLKAKRGHGLFTSWIPHAEYSSAELAAAEILRLSVPAVFEPPGEEVGTKYEDGDACDICGIGRRQVSDLVLDLRRVQTGRDIETQTVPRKDIARSIADEVVVSTRFADALTKSGMTGIRLRPVFQVGRRDPSPTWRQLVIGGTPVVAIPPTKFGIDPFDMDPEGSYRCPRGHIAGLNLLSEVTIDRASWSDSDAAKTSEAVGWRQGLLVPAPLFMVSSRFQALVAHNSFTGASLAIAHLAGSP
jgi:hypothetical protein